MYMRVTRGRFDPAAAAQVAAVSREVRAAVGRLPGFQHIQTGIDRAAGRMAAISLWDTEEHARFPREAVGEALGRARDAGVELEPPEILEVPD
jgi:heme-degrading monooxygenase HmoA